MTDPVDTLVGTRVQRLRSRAGISSSELADLLQIDTTRLSDVEAGRDRAGPDMLELLARAFGIPIWSFFHPAIDDQAITEADRDNDEPPERPRSSLH